MKTDEPLTVSELAEHITRSGDPAEIARVTRRLRHLTTIGALDTEGEMHTGAGRHRLYGPDSTAAAAVLVALGDMGLTVGILKEAARLIRMTMLPTTELGGMRSRWEDAIAGKPILFGIAIAASADERAGEPRVLTVFLGPTEEFSARRESFGFVGSGLVLIDLQHLFRTP
jgi:hypothetical protein